eukprot:TRINITY_DN4298_c0_g1_i1.p1 TRINITY_DN4298_c0_g1~~TRINITY_DN4298_c0_g1_i1.p1  ORF type:complete len:234 (-),score=49.65 TRINITY_DN4298_c0_g1_i1:35-679(-)
MCIRDSCSIKLKNYEVLMKLVAKVDEFLWRDLNNAWMTTAPSKEGNEEETEFRIRLHPAASKQKTVATIVWRVIAFIIIVLLYLTGVTWYYEYDELPLSFAYLTCWGGIFIGAYIFLAFLNQIFGNRLPMFKLTLVFLEIAFSLQPMIILLYWIVLFPTFKNKNVIRGLTMHGGFFLILLIDIASSVKDVIFFVEHTIITVSYTHLTLPTIYSV